MFAVVKRIDPRLPNTWGHWWIELNDDESYGWWPDPCPMGWRGALLGTGGVLNGIGTTDGGSTTRDAYHGDEPDHCFHPTLLIDKSDDEVCADIRAFAHSYRGGFRWQWWWLRQPGENCRTFQDELFEAVGLREEPDHLYTRGAGCPFMYPFRRVKWRTIDTAADTVARMRRWSPIHRRTPRPNRGTDDNAQAPGRRRRRVARGRRGASASQDQGHDPIRSRWSAMTRVLVLAAFVAALLAPASAAAPRASLVDIEDEVMCVTCKIPLSIAESPQATKERDLIRRLINRGLDKQQIKSALVAEYGQDVLALPGRDGFGITAYAVPIALLVVVGAALALLLPRWRSRAPAGIGDDKAQALSSVDARRLDDDLARYDR